MDQFFKIRKETISTTREIERFNGYEIHECRSIEHPGLPLVLKRYSFEDLHEKSDIAKIFEEVKILCNLPPIEGLAAYRGAYIDEDGICIVRDEIEGQTLKQIIPGNTFTPTEIKHICLQISRVVQSLHDHHIFNYNLKPTNVFHTSGNRIVICDFAMVELRESLDRKAYAMGEHRKTDIAITPPELFSTGQYAKELSDVYSIGLLMWMLAAKKIPKVRRFPPIEVTDEGLKKIVKAVIIPDPTKRPILSALQNLLSEAIPQPTLPQSHTSLQPETIAAAKVAQDTPQSSNHSGPIQASLATISIEDASATSPAPTPAIQATSPPGLREYVLKETPLFHETSDSKLGKGGQARVYKGTYQGKSVAIKVIKPDSENAMMDAADEVILTKRVAHPNIIDIIGVHLGPQGMLIVMELASDSLKGMIDKRKGPLTPFEIVSFGKQIADALNYCVTLNPREPICYRDLKTDNVVIVNGQAKLVDFGFAYIDKRPRLESLDDDVEGTGAEGTPHWQGPEIYNTVCKSNWDVEKYGGENVGHRGERSDVYAFGLLLWSMATGKYPFMDKHPHQISVLTFNGERPEIPSDVHPTLTHLIRSCWRQNYRLRPRFSNIVAILSMYGAGNLDAVRKQDLDYLVPIQYSPVQYMYPGELYEYLAEQGVPQSIAVKLRSQQMNGEFFNDYDSRKFMDTFKLNKFDAQRLVSLNTWADAPNKI